MSKMLVVRWKEGDSYFEDHKIIDKEIPMDIALQMVENGDAEIVEMESEALDVKDFTLIPMGNINDLIEDYDTSKPGRWVTIDGKHVYIYKGYKPVVGKNGKITQVKKGTATEKEAKLQKETKKPLPQKEKIQEKKPITQKTTKKVSEKEKIPIKKESEEKGKEKEEFIKINFKPDAHENLNLTILNKRIKELPEGIKKRLPNIEVYKKITDHPSLKEYKGKTPEYFKKAGIDSTYDEILGMYLIKSKDIVLKSIDSKQGREIAFHEIGHAIWEGMESRDQTAFKLLWHKHRDVLKKGVSEKGKKVFGLYEANDVREFFAETFSFFYTKKQQPRGFSDIKRFFEGRGKKYES